MHDEIRVRVVEFGSKPHYQVQWADPEQIRPDGTPKIHTRSTGVARRPGRRGREEAERFAERLQTELNANSGRLIGKVRWEDFRTRYEAEHACTPNLRQATVDQITSILDRFKKEMRPQYLVDVTAGTLSKYAQVLREVRLAEATIKKHLAHLIAGLKWACDIGGMIREVPRRPATPNARKSLGEKPKGRSVAMEEFERWLKAVPQVKQCKNKPDRVREICEIMQGLMWTGLRIEELMTLSWDSGADISLEWHADAAPRICINSPSAQKNNCSSEIPVTPELKQMLEKVKRKQRHGFVFRANGKQGRLTAAYVGRLIAEAGELAGIKVGRYERTGKTKYATAHDLRRSFADFYKHRINMNDLRILMRHSAISTTQRYYVGVQTDELARKLQASDRREILPEAPKRRPQKA
jgi:integrase